MPLVGIRYERVLWVPGLNKPIGNLYPLDYKKPFRHRPIRVPGIDSSSRFPRRYLFHPLTNDICHIKPQAGGFFVLANDFEH